MKVNSFFCGAGGFDLGFIQAGFEIVGAWDFDKYAVQSYNHNIGGAEQADVSLMKGQDLKKADGWLFGFPCQDISVAGKQKGMIKGQTRSGLFYEIMRLLDEVEDKPEWILAENVKAVKKFIPEIREEYAKAGYWLVEPQLYNSKYWGVPQNRERYFLMGIRFENNKPFSFPTQQTDFIPKLSSVLESDVDEKFYINEEKTKAILEKFSFNSDEAFSAPLKFLNRNQNELPDYSMTVDCSQTNGVGYKVKQATKKGYDIAIEGDSINISHPNSKTRRGMVGKQVTQTLLTGTEQIVVVGSLEHYGNDQMNRVYDPEGISHTALVVSGGGGGREIKILEPCNLSKKGTEFDKFIEQTGTLLARDYKGFPTVGFPAVIENRYRVRKLTPREYARLQGFPESYEQIVSNSQFYKQMGNAVTVNVAHAIATAIKEQL